MVGQRSCKPHLLGVALLAATAGCGGSQPIDVAAHPKLEPKAMVEFEYRGAKVQLDSVLITRDSISGIPWHEPALCCKRVGYALADISKPAVHTFPALGAILGVVIGIVIYLGYEISIHFRD
jgi:hypothetical protein